MQTELDVMCSSQLPQILIEYLKRSAHSLKRLDQILAQSITTGLIHTNPTWNCLLRAYSNSCTPFTTIFIYNHFISSNSIQPDNYTYPVILKACSSLNSLPKGKEIHANITKLGLCNDIYVQNSLIHFYGSTGQIVDARFLFDKMSQRDITSWNSLLGVYHTNSEFKIESLVLFKEMMGQSIGPDSITLVIVLSALAEARWGDYGSAMHGYAQKVGLCYTLNLENAFLGVYVKCGKMSEALRLFNEMGSIKDVVSHTILVKGFAEMGFINMAREIFDQVREEDIVLWNSMIHGYIAANRPNDALEIFNKMENEIIKPDETTIVSVLSACAYLSDLKYGRSVHRFILENNLKQDVFVGTALIDMYSKCGSVEEAMVTFYKMANRDVFTWTTAIEALANHGYSNEALKLFHQMESQGLKANEATFVSVLSACKQGDLLEEGCLLFGKMMRVYGIDPKLEHFGCMIHILSRADMVNQAEVLINIIPRGKRRFVAYKTLLSACMSYSKLGFGLKVADELRKLGSKNKEVYILLSNFYALAGKWSKVAEMRRKMKNFGMVKDPGISSIDLET